MIRFRSAKRFSIDPAMIGFGFDSGFYDGGRFLFVQIGRRVWGLWLE